MSQSAAIGAALRKAVGRAAKALTLAIDAELRKNPSAGGTPVDTGHARANWVPSIGSPHTGEVEGSAAHAQGVSQIIAYELEQGPLYVANGVPYIQRLNYGHSKQAPALFVEAAVDRALGAVQARFGKSIAITQNEFRQEMGAIGAENLASAYNPLGGSDD